MDRTCKRCGITQPVESFANAGKVNGKQYYRHVCKPCYSDQKKDAKQVKKDWFIEYKKTLVCSRCGFNDYRALQFHHLKNKEFALGDAIKLGYSIKRIKEEIEKCEVLCANCHQIEHFSP